MEFNFYAFKIVFKHEFFNFIFQKKCSENFNKIKISKNK